MATQNYWDLYFALPYNSTFVRLFKTRGTLTYNRILSTVNYSPGMCSIIAPPNRYLLPREYHVLLSHVQPTTQFHSMQLPLLPALRKRSTTSTLNSSLPFCYNITTNLFASFAGRVMLSCANVVVFVRDFETKNLESQTI